jgi:hypothetical protein
MRPFRSVSAGEGRTRVHADVYRVGEDLLVVLGGEGPHIGAASMAEAVPGDEPRVSTIVAPPHKEAELTEHVSRAICGLTGRRTVVVAGIHLDDITAGEIEAIRRNVRGLVRRLEADEMRDGSQNPARNGRVS